MVPEGNLMRARSVAARFAAPAFAALALRSCDVAGV
jgi:hypothetical protein